MYSLYKEFMENKNRTPVASESRYRYIFNNEYNLFFHPPKKDQCDQCSSFDALSKENQQLEKYKVAHEIHLRNKLLARQLMQEDNDIAKQDSSILCASFDEQKVLSCPESQLSSMYYKRKLSIYNFTILNLNTKEGKCNVWNESYGKRGADEISSCLWLFIQDQCTAEIKEFNFFSDNCTGQNRNQTLFTMYIKAALGFGITITHRFILFKFYLIFK